MRPEETDGDTGGQIAMASSRPIFIFGCPRSGTTLLSLALHAHPRVAIPPETRFLLEVFRGHRSFGDLRERENRRDLAHSIVRRRDTKFRDLGLSRPQTRRAIVAAPPTVGSAIGTVFRHYAESAGKERWGSKYPTYFRNVDVILTLFPDAQFVHVVRDGRDSVASLSGMGWWRQGTVAAMAMWVHAIDCGRRAERRLPSDAYLQIRYEDLVTEPRPELERLCAFLGEDFDDAMLEPHLVASALPQRERDKWHANTEKQLSSERVGTFADALSQREIDLMNWAAGGRLRSLGYDAPGGGWRRVSAVAAWNYRWRISMLRLATVTLRWRDRWRARPAGLHVDMGSD